MLRVSLLDARMSSWIYRPYSGRFSVYVVATNRLRVFELVRPSRKLATSKPVAELTVQPEVTPAQFDVGLLLKPKFPTIVSAFRISRERKVTLPPALKVSLPVTLVTLSKNCRSFWFVISGWLLLAPRFRMFLNVSWVIPEVASLRLIPGMPAAAAGFFR